MEMKVVSTPKEALPPEEDPEVYYGLKKSDYTYDEDKKKEAKEKFPVKSKYGPSYYSDDTYTNEGANHKMFLTYEEALERAKRRTRGRKARLAKYGRLFNHAMSGRGMGLDEEKLRDICFRVPFIPGTFCCITDKDLRNILLLSGLDSGIMEWGSCGNLVESYARRNTMRTSDFVTRGGAFELDVYHGKEYVVSREDVLKGLGLFLKLRYEGNKVDCLSRFFWKYNPFTGEEDDDFMFVRGRGKIFEGKTSRNVIECAIFGKCEDPFNKKKARKATKEEEREMMREAFRAMREMNYSLGDTNNDD